MAVGRVFGSDVSLASFLCQGERCRLTAVPATAMS